MIMPIDDMTARTDRGDGTAWESGTMIIRWHATVGAINPIVVRELWWEPPRE